MSMRTRVALIEDHIAVREGIQALLTLQKDMQIVGGVGTAHEAIQLVAREHPDVAVLDVSLPDLAMFDTMQRLFNAHAPLKVVVFTMHSTPEIVAQAFHAGASAYVLKSSHVDDLLTAIRRAVRGESYLCATLRKQGTEPVLASGRRNVRLYELTGREREVLKLIADGKTNTQMARELRVSTKSVDTYRARIKKKLGLNHVSELVKFAIRQGITTV